MANVDSLSILNLLWKISLQAGALALVVFLLSRFAKNAPAKLRYTLWVIALVKFLVPPFAYVPSQLAFWQVEPQAITAPAASPKAMSMVVESPPVADPRGASSVTGAEERMPATPPAAASVGGSPKASGFSLPDTALILAFAWLVGLGVSLVLLLARCARQRKLLRESVEAEPVLTEALVRAAESLGVRRLPELRVSENASTPVLAGLRNLTIVLPSCAASSCSPSDVQAMLLHELAHIKRHDLTVAWLYRLVSVLFFFHPALWLIGGELENERELACDELVLSSSAILPADYAAGYVAVLKMATGPTAAVPVSLGMAEPFEIGKRRLETMLRESVSKLSVGWMLALVIIAATGLTTFAGVQQDLKTEKNPATPAHSQPKVKAPKADANGKDLLQTIANGTHRACAAIVSGKGRITVREWRITSNSNPKGPISEHETASTVAFAGDKFRMSLGTTLLRNDHRAAPGMIPNPPGYKGSYEILVDGKTITSLRQSSYNVAGKIMPDSPRATVGSGQSWPGETGGFVILKDRRPFVYSPASEIELTGRWFPGNGILDLTKLRFGGKSFKNNTYRVVGADTLNGSRCHIVELVAPGASEKINDLVVRIWVDPSRGFTTPRVRMYRQHGRWPKRFLAEEADTLLRRYGHGVWGPAKVVQNYYSLDSHGKPYKDRVKTITYHQGFQLNAPISEDELALKLPPFTEVYDEKTEAYYRVQENGEWLPEVTSAPKNTIAPTGANQNGVAVAGTVSKPGRTESGVEPGKVEIKAQVFHVSADLTKELGLSELKLGTAAENVAIAKLRGVPRNPGVRLIAAPIVAAVDGTEASIEVSSSDTFVSFQVLPSIKENNKIMLGKVGVKIKDLTVANGSTSHIVTSRMVANGGSVISSVWERQEGTDVVVVSARIVD